MKAHHQFIHLARNGFVLAIFVSLLSVAKELKIYRNGNSSNLFLYATMAENFLELFTSNLNGIVVSARHVRSTSVVRHAGLDDPL